MSEIQQQSHATVELPPTRALDERILFWSGQFTGIQTQRSVPITKKSRIACVSQATLLRKSNPHNIDNILSIDRIEVSVCMCEHA